jgi:DMSO/TMAO reductase YedYZ molybdopterin-dependent catalytic subunit
MLGAGLDGRLFTDLSTLAPLGSTDAAAPATPTERFFVRTTAPSSLPPAGRRSAWRVTVGGLVREPVELGPDALDRMIAPTRRSLIECAGNGNTAAYGLMSVADWEGVPLPAILDHVRPTSGAYRVLVSGLDDETTTSRTSIPGASWVFSRDDLQQAVLAVRMNGAPLPPDHGAPVRLVVPNWYGCACIKWVDRIELVPDDAPPTSQMVEYSGRTHQAGFPKLARDYAPAVMDVAAMPVRVERWSVDGRVVYRVVGIVWGGTKPTRALAIRFKTGQPWTAVESCPLPGSTLTWSVWTHTWKPDAPGRYDLVLKVTDPSIRTRRLDLFYYVRTVDIDEV